MSTGVEKRIIFMDDPRLLPDLSGSSDVLIITLDSQAASELRAPAGVNVRSILEYADMPPASYDELYARHRDSLREQLRPKDPDRQSRFLFEAFWEDIVLNHAGIAYIRTLIVAIYRQERPACVELAIGDRQSAHLFRAIVEEIRNRE